MLDEVIGQEQTAYIPGRMINDNIRAIIKTVESADIDGRIDGLLVSLDARKAFDSVSHAYIKKCLQKFGLNNFVPIFETLYSDQSCDILLNGEILPGYKILRGVKQGDALSCILFILCMEPLILNIKNNRAIRPIQIDDFKFPTVYSFADDINAIIVRSAEGLQAIFTENCGDQPGENCEKN